MADDDKEVGAAYVPWNTFKKALSDLAKEGLPNQIDRSVWKGQSWGTQSQLITAFKFLGLTDDKGKPTDWLVGYADPENGEAEHKALMGIIFKEKYADLFALDLTKATPDQLDKAMAGYRVSGETREKAVRFFLSGLAYLGIPVSKHLLPAKAANGAAPRKRRGRKPKQAEPITAAPASQPAGNTKVIMLRSGGTLTVSATLDYFALSPADRRFFNEIIEKLEEYDIPPGQSQADTGGEE